MTDMRAIVYAPDFTVETLDIAELGRLLQLVLGCAVNCEDKQGTCAILYMNEFMNCICIVIVLFTQF